MIEAVLSGGPMNRILSCWPPALDKVGQNAEAAILYRDAVRIVAAEGDPMRFDTLMIEMRYGDFLSRAPATQGGARAVLRAANRRALQRAAAYPSSDRCRIPR